MSGREKGERPSSGRQGAIGRGDSKFTHTIPWWHTYSHPHIPPPSRVRFIQLWSLSHSIGRPKLTLAPDLGGFPRTDFTRAYPVAPSPHAITASLHALPFHHTSQIRTIPYAGAVFRSALHPQRQPFLPPCVILHGCPSA